MLYVFISERKKSYYYTAANCNIHRPQHTHETSMSAKCVSGPVMNIKIVL